MGNIHDEFRQLPSFQKAVDYVVEEVLRVIKEEGFCERTEVYLTMCEATDRLQPDPRRAQVDFFVFKDADTKLKEECGVQQWEDFYFLEQEALLQGLKEGKV